MKLGLIFDMDGVIVDNHRYHFKAWQVMCEKYGKPLDETSYRENLNGRTLKEVVQFIFEEEMTMDRIREIGLEKEEIYRDIYQPYLSPTPGLIEFLGAANDADYPMVIGTSAPSINVEFTINGIGFGHYFKGILDDRAVNKGKPDPEIYIKCAQTLGLPNDRCVVFEDAVSGIKAGKAAGSKVVALATSHNASELSADLIIDDFTGISLEQIEELIGK